MVLRTIKLWYLFYADNAADIARFMQPDPLATENHGVSPYTYCNGDPINFIDPTGEKVYFVNGTGRIISEEEAGKHQSFNMTELEAQYNNYDGIVIIDKNGRIVNQSKKFEEGSILSIKETNIKIGEKTDGTFTNMKVKGDKAAISVFKFLADNITATNGIEIGLNLNGKYSFGSVNEGFTSHTASAIHGIDNVLNDKSISKGIRHHIHSHPDTPIPSVIDYDNMMNITGFEVKNSYRSATFSVYYVRTKKFIRYKEGSRFVDHDHKIKRRK